MLSFPTEISDIFHACYTDLFNKYVPSHSSKGKNHSATADSNTGSKSWRAVRVHLKNDFFSQFKFVRWCKKILFWHWVWESRTVLGAKLLWPTWLSMIFFTSSCISCNAEKYHLPQYLLPQFPVTALQVVSPRLRISTTILSLGSHSPPGRSHLPLGLPATWWQLAITLLLLRPPAPPESQVMRWLWFPEPSQGRWNAIFHCHR